MPTPACTTPSAASRTAPTTSVPSSCRAGVEPGVGGAGGANGATGVAGGAGWSSGRSIGWPSPTGAAAAAGALTGAFGRARGAAFGFGAALGLAADFGPAFGVAAGFLAVGFGLAADLALGAGFGLAAGLAAAAVLGVGDAAAGAGVASVAAALGRRALRRWGRVRGRPARTSPSPPDGFSVGLTPQSSHPHSSRIRRRPTPGREKKSSGG